MSANKYNRHKVVVEFDNTYAVDNLGTNTIVLLLAEETVTAAPASAPAAITSAIAQARQPPVSEDFNGAKGKAVTLYELGKRVVLVGLGPRDKIDDGAIRKATDVAVKSLRTAKIESAKFFFLEGNTAPRGVEVMANTIVLSDYRYDHFLTDPSLKPCRLKRAIVFYEGASISTGLARALALADSVCYARDMGNHRADDANPAFYEEEAHKLAREFDALSVEVLQMEDLKRLGMNLHVAVGQAGPSPPRLVLITYNGDPSSEKRVGLVGKGITFDTGGLNLKMTGMIEDMHMDMCGTAAVLGATRAIASLGLKVNTITALALAENAIDANSFHPHSILRSRKGLSVEIANTDAEGRLVLADALTYVQDKYNPDTILDFATLTGACIVALGEYAAGVFSNDDQFARKLMDYGNDVFERTWHLPILPDHEEEIKGTVADIRNLGKARYGGASTAAAFLKRFINDGVTWAHVDIAGPGMYNEERGHMPKGSTGFGVQLITRFLHERQLNAEPW